MSLRDGAWHPPLPPPDHGNDQDSVPLWEREFCCSVGNISWQTFHENKRYVSVLTFDNLWKWDDSGALENFQNAKTRFWANYHGQPSDIPLPDPDMYIDEIDHHCKFDSYLIDDLDKIWLPVDSDNNSAPVLEWPSAGVENKLTQNQSEIWDVDEWEWKPSPGSNATWGRNNESASTNHGWSAALEKAGVTTSTHQTRGINNRYKPDTSSKRIINRGTTRKASKGAGGRILKEKRRNGVQCPTVQAKMYKEWMVALDPVQ